MKLRFIPACAGNIIFVALCKSVVSVHPRVCGEHIIHTVLKHLAAGSSPRVRGTLFCVAMLFQHWRFIPACAGNITELATLADGITVHPRVCGEHCTNFGNSFLCTGSSPRVRGTYGTILFPEYPFRFIPACAGNMNANNCVKRLQPVHPRVCGEHTTADDALIAAIGSSPRVRGTSAFMG